MAKGYRVKALFNKIYHVITERRLPYFVSSRIHLVRNSYYFYKNQLIHRKKVGSDNQIKITFRCDFQGLSGPTFSIPDIANSLAKSNFEVEFLSFPKSNYNPQLSREVNIVKKVDLDSDVYVVDVTCEHNFVKEALSRGKVVITTVHGKLHSGHGLDSQYVKKSVDISSVSRFVSWAQQTSFQLSEGKFIVIPNMAKKVNKSKFTDNVGVVGNLSNKDKNANLTIEMGLKSNANKIQLWGVGSDFESDESCVLSYGWESNKQKIFNSFDVMVFMSSEENCPKAVIEALSAGIPCVLSDIDAHRDFARCEGVKLVPIQDYMVGVEAINNFLLNKDKLRESIINFWNENYSEQTFMNSWSDFIQTQIQKDSANS